MIHWTSRAKFLDKRHNKSQLITLLKSTFEKMTYLLKRVKLTQTLLDMEALHAADHCMVEVGWK